MKISVIIPVYNVEDYIGKCLDSVLRQSYKNIEIVLVNDGSTDNSGKICEKYSDNHSNIKLINKINGGVSAARNLGIANSTGDYLIFLDSDDYWGKDFLTSIVEKVREDRDIDYIFFRVKYYFQVKDYYEEEDLYFEHEKISRRPGIVALKEILRADQVFQWFPCRGLIRRDFLIENQLYFEVGMHYEDALLIPTVFLKAKKVDYYDDAIYIYRLQRKGQITSNFNYRNLSDSLYTSVYWESELDKYGLDDETRILFMKTFVSGYHFSLRFSGFIDSEDREILIKELKASKSLLKYNSDFITSVTYVLCNLLGFDVTSIVFKLMISAKRKLRDIKG